MPEGSDFKLEAVLTQNGTLDTATINAAGTVVLTVSDSVLNSGVALLTDEATDSFTTDTGLAEWAITDTQSNGWASGTYNGDIKLTDTSGLVHYWPVSLKVRDVRD